MTDLATEQQADKTSGDGVVEAEQAVESEASAQAETSTADAVDETNAVVDDGEEADAVDETDTTDETDTAVDDADAVDATAAIVDETDAGEDDAADEAAELDETDTTDGTATVDETAATDGTAATDETAAVDDADTVDETDTTATPDAVDETDAADDLTADAEADTTADIDDANADVDPSEPEDPAAAEAAASAALSPESEVSAPEALTTAGTEDAATATAVMATAVLAPASTAPAAEATTEVGAPGDGSPVYAWAPAEPKPKKKRTAVWISAAAAVAAIGLVASSLMLIAPGTAVAGVPVGWLTPGAAADAISQRLAETTVVLTGDGGDAEVTGADLGASVDAKALADAAFAEHPMWNPTAWFAETGASVELDTATATEALRDAAPKLYTDPVDATLGFDAASATYVATPAVPGTGIDVATVQAALQAAFEAGKIRVKLDAVEAEVPATISTAVADAAVTKLNGMLDAAGFYVGDERTVPIDRAVAASWLTVTPKGEGFAITADAADIQPVVDTLAGTINRAPENAIEITDTGGKILKEIAAGQSGRQLGDTSGVADAFADQLGTGDAAFKLPVEEVPVSVTTLARNIVIDLSDQAAYFYENGVVVSSTRMSSGLPGHDTHTGNFRIRAKLAIQNMGNPDLTKAPYYYTKNVPWVMYFNGDQALHGAYWHNNFGHRMSHGCVNLPVDVAKFLYDWAPMGTEVRVQS